MLLYMTVEKVSSYLFAYDWCCYKTARVILQKDTYYFDNNRISFVNCETERFVKTELKAEEWSFNVGILLDLYERSKQKKAYVTCICLISRVMVRV